MMSPSQVRMACAGLGWNWDDLAQAAEISRDTIARFLRGAELRPGTVAAIRSALEDAGVIFISEDEASERGGPGVRLAKRKRKQR